MRDHPETRLWPFASRITVVWGPETPTRIAPDALPLVTLTLHYSTTALAFRLFASPEAVPEGEGTE